MRRARVSAFIVLGVLITVGVTMTVVAPSESTMRELGLAVVGGGVVGGGIVVVEALLSTAASEREARASLLRQISSTLELTGIDLRDQRFPGVYLPSRNLVAARLQGIVLDDAQLYFSDLRYADLRNASLRGADLSGSALAGSDVRSADLSGAIMRDVDLGEAQLGEARLVGSDLTGASLRNADLKRVDCSGARLTACDMRGADLSSARLHGANLERIRHDASTRWPTGAEVPESVIVEYADFARMDLAEYLAQREPRSET